MLAIFFKTLPFFGLIFLGYAAGRTRFFSEEATAALTKFVFYFALSAMLFRFTAGLSIEEIFDPRLAMAYLWGTSVVWGIGLVVAYLRWQDTPTAVIEAQCIAIGNTGFLGVPMLVLLIGPQAVGPVILVLVIDLIVFSSILTILVSASRGEGGLASVVRTALMGLVKNPMIVSISLGLVMSALAVDLHPVLDEFLGILGAAATPCALFAIGASLASKSAERLEIAIWISFGKLVLHPLFVAAAAYLFFPVEPFKAAVAVAAASMPVAGNVFILAQHYGIAPQRVSASILVSTLVSIFTVSAVIAWVTGA